MAIEKPASYNTVIPVAILSLEASFVILMTKEFMLNNHQKVVILRPQMPEIEPSKLKSKAERINTFPFEQIEANIDRLNLLFSQKYLSIEDRVANRGGKPINLLRRRSFPGLSTSRIGVDERGIVIQHTLGSSLYNPLRGPFTQRNIDMLVTPDLLGVLWKHGEARSLIKDLANLDPDKAFRKAA